MTLEGKSVVITGGNGGIGLGMAETIGHAGARVAIWGRNEAKNTSAVSYLRAKGITASSFVCHVDQPESVATAAQRSAEAMGGIDSMIANAGVSSDRSAFVDVSLNEWHRVMATNLDGVFLAFQEATRVMIEQDRGGALVAVSSTSAIHGAAHNLAYGTSKTALLGLVRGLAVELARYKIRVNALLPGWTRTDLSSAGFEDDRFREVTTRRTPARRWAAPEEMGPAAALLADPAHTFHTGDTITVDGGYTVF